MSVADEILRIQQAKSDLATSITNKGVTVPAATTIDGYAALVDQIQTSGLPYNAQLEYIQCSGTQYIDTEAIITSGMNVSIRFGVTVRDSKDNQLFGYGNGTTMLSNSVTSGNNIRSRWGDRSSYKELAMNLNDIFLFTVTGNSVVLKNQTRNTSVSYTAGSAFSDVPFPVGAYNNWGTVSAMTRGMRIYSIVIGSLRNMVPVRVDQVGYMYDKVSGTLFGNAGTGSFVLGPDVT